MFSSWHDLDGLARRFDTQSCGWVNDQWVEARHSVSMSLDLELLDRKPILEAAFHITPTMELFTSLLSERTEWAFQRLPNRLWRSLCMTSSRHWTVLSLRLLHEFLKALDSTP